MQTRILWFGNIGVKRRVTSLFRSPGRNLAVRNGEDGLAFQPEKSCSVECGWTATFGEMLAALGYAVVSKRAAEIAQLCPALRDDSEHSYGASLPWQSRFDEGCMRVPVYAASKGGVAPLTKALANEWADRNVQVNAIAPGYFRTTNTMALQQDEVRNRQILDRIPEGRWGEAEDVGGAAVFIASPASNYITGEVLIVDGGWMSR
jgi:hypothetical protein